ncbi:hypothetical protein Pint_33948 [Pistacia integerrima]|uniref:Uncharacterized protein n=1 Tax=Pistacia integerrima TaxID=434235 RepID=A0ACC0X757_9ROSI|nr:hypothetical protein Pint_33948 [Pistacia integerrima]
MRLKGTLFSLPMHLLVDSGSTHNFISSFLVAKVGLHLQEKRSFEVTVASGKRLTSPGQCNLVTLHIKGIPLQLDFYLLPLDGYEIVLGTQWLMTLGPIIWDFSKLQMRFAVLGKDVCLQVLASSQDKLVENFCLERVLN